MFALGWQTSEVLYSVGQSAPSLNGWRDIFLQEIEECMRHPKQEHFVALHQVFKNLDWGKTFISEGYDWLRTKLHSNFFPQP
jgi:hypothetical protein